MRTKRAIAGVAFFCAAHAWATNATPSKHVEPEFIGVVLVDRLYELVDEADPEPIEPPLSVERVNRRRRLYEIAEGVAREMNRKGALKALADPAATDTAIDADLKAIRPVFMARCARALLCKAPPRP